jgi:predicted RNA methylase
MILLMSRLRCTVSGGLEEFARKELEMVLQPEDLKRDPSDSCSIQLEKGNSGSRIYVNGIACLGEDPMKLCEWMRKLRYVEYISLHLGTATAVVMDGDETGHEELGQSKTELLRAITNATRSILSSLKYSIEHYVYFWTTIQRHLREFQVGLEPLPGVLLPTPIMQADFTGYDDLPSFLFQRQRPSFIVNTIFTRPIVARSVVPTFRQVVFEHIADQRDVLWLDAGCGTHGSLLQHLPQGQRMGIDIDLGWTDGEGPFELPNGIAADMHQADFLDVTLDWIKARNASKDFRHLVVLSNPPFAVDSRGNYRPIVQFIRRSFETLNATIMGVIVPTKFARRRVMESLGLQILETKKSIKENRGVKVRTDASHFISVNLVARMNLPDHAFYDPHTLETKHIAATLMIFTSCCQPLNERMNENTAPDLAQSSPLLRLRVDGYRNKADFPLLRTNEIEQAVQIELRESWKDHIISSYCESGPSTMAISSHVVKVRDHPNVGCIAVELQLFLLLNPKRPLSLVNCTSRNEFVYPPHSLGWLSTSCKPAVAHAMLQAGIENCGRWRGPSSCC